MSKPFHEIRDPIHVFVRLDSDERKVLDSRPFQRLRHIHQLAMTYLLYPAATHKRFEHSLGVMELAGRVFDVVTNPAHITDAIRQELPELSQPDKLNYWLRVLRMAALCHDMGHLPFSHAAEKELLPEGWNHERLTREIILSEEMRQIWNAVTPPLRAEDIVKLALGPKEADDMTFSPWEAVLSEIIVGDAFGVDRMDYLLRDSHHIGVAYGKFDHFRLIDTLRILPTDSGPALGVERGGLHSAEALLLARYFMYTQVYFHPIRRIYDILLKDFLAEWLPGGKFDTDLEKHLSLTDDEVLSAIHEASRDSKKPGHAAARRIVRHEHFKMLYERHPDDVKVNPDAGAAVAAAAQEKFGPDNVRRDAYTQKRPATLFPVLHRDGQILDAGKLSEVLEHLPVVTVDFVYIRPDLRNEAKQWLRQNRGVIIGELAKEE
ncbi:MAG: HD domain-containing protein [Gemmataceae bacterium]|jgi:HD superfamily phosphohydrolase|uniref:HD domain-containing protein n=1 Tax=Thermogemmata fonticola TaxID=2755323 RepID=A0A7V9ABK8_9BACT|nr:HD domain-containing protein [Thermogemmata fonticola]MBA2226044.1 HD domain-containing protein [Thermogemmata fonticola]MCX8139751.1 HD domain-containing protein [Gemmataceae bacterium]